MEGVLTHSRSGVYIIGAGPAGLSTALFLAKKGIYSTLIEKETFPRDKICGDGLSGWVVTMLRRLDPELLLKLQSLPDQLPSHGIRFHAPNMQSIALPYQDTHYPGEPPGHLIRRIDFDRLLMDEALRHPMIEVIQGVAIDQLEQASDGVILTDRTTSRQYMARICVIATGANSPLAHMAVPHRTDFRHQATGIRQYYSGVTGVHEGNYVDFYFLKEFLPGYLWIFPLPNGTANVGAGIRTDLLKKRRLTLKQVMERAISENPVLAERFKEAHPISGTSAWSLPLGSRKVRLSGNRILLTGDAGSLIDPFTGEGVGNALWSGFAASEHIHRALSANCFDTEFNLTYDHFVYDKLWKELRQSALIQRLINYPGLFNRVMNKAVAHPEMQQSLIRMIGNLDERNKLTHLWYYLKALCK